MNKDSFLKRLARTAGIFLLLTVSLLAACGQSGQNKEPKQQSAQQQQQTEKIPPKLKDIDNSIQEIVKELEEQKDPWKNTSTKIDKLHFQWNEFMPEAMKKGASLKITESFSNSLNSLTTTASSNDKSRTLLAANGLYGSIPDLYSLYRTKMSPEIKRMHYLIRNIILTSEAGDWTQAEKDMRGLKASWNVSRNSLGKEQEKDQGKLDTSVTELEKVVAEKNRQLTAIKGKVALSNVEAVEKVLEKESEKSGGGSKQGG